MTTATSGLSSDESSMSSDRPGSSSKTCQGSCGLRCATCWPILLGWGSMRSGRLSLLLRSVRLTAAIEFSSSLGMLPTPLAGRHDLHRRSDGSAEQSKKVWRRASVDHLLRTAMLPTPMAQEHDYRNPPKARTTWDHSRTVGSMIRRALLPTPTLCGDWNRRGSSQSSGDGLSVWVGSSILWREWMMGFPRDWTNPDT